jgi:hypothetical protein
MASASEFDLEISFGNRNSTFGIRSSGRARFILDSGRKEPNIAPLFDENETKGVCGGGSGH